MTEKLDHLMTAWRGHEGFAIRTMQIIKPEVTVDLGVDFGFSTLAFALPNIGNVYGIDTFWGDWSKGDRNTYEAVCEEIEKLGLRNVEIIKQDIDEAAKEWKMPIDILHIDADHEYESVKRNFDTWLPFVKRSGVIMLHDTISFAFDVGRLFEELPYPKHNFEHSAGLGVICFEQSVLDSIINPTA